jgi:hypothetical protein
MLVNLLPGEMAKRPMFGRKARHVLLDNELNFGKTWLVPVEAVKDVEAPDMRFHPGGGDGMGGCGGCHGEDCDGMGGGA